MKNIYTASQWKERFLKMLNEHGGKFPYEYPYRHWHSKVKSGMSLAMLKGWMEACLEFEKDKL